MSQNLTFPVGSIASQCVDVVIVDDDIQEVDEEFMVIADGTTGDYVNFNGVVTFTIEGTAVEPGSYRPLASVPASLPSLVTIPSS